MERFEDYVEMARRCLADARRTADPRYRSFLVDMAATWCKFAKERLDTAGDRRYRPEEATRAVTAFVEAPALEVRAVALESPQFH
jgi:hypothetical protein